MPLSVITGSPVPGKSGVTLMARIRGQSHSLLTQAALSSITYVLTDTTTGTQITTGTFTIADVVFDTLQQDDGSWTKDSRTRPGSDGEWGYNFRAVLPASIMIPAGDRFQCDVIFTPTTGEPFRVPFQVRTVEVFG